MLILGGIFLNVGGIRCYFTKLIFDAETHRVIGGAIVAPSAGDMIGEICLPIEMGCDAVDIGRPSTRTRHSARRSVWRWK